VFESTRAAVDVTRDFDAIDPEEFVELDATSADLERLRQMGMIRKALPGLPKPDKIKVTKAEYVSSAKSIHQCPPPRYVEFAVIGRSNVGKSSLINALTGTKNLASVSKQPGKTRDINHYLVDNNWYMVDLPGYGYAKVRKTERFGWHKATQQFFLERKTLALVMLLVDSSIPPQQIDIDCAYWLGESKIPFMIVFTKKDKTKKGMPKPDQNIKTFLRTLAKDWENEPAHVATSSQTQAGLQELLTYISQIRKVFSMEVKQGFWTQAREKQKKDDGTGPKGKGKKNKQRRQKRPRR